MSEIKEYKKIMNIVERAFVKSRNYILTNIKKEVLEDMESDREGDISCEHDKKIFRLYTSALASYDMLIISEENRTKFEDPLYLSKRHKYVLILDAIDGTVNLKSNLQFGVNVAFGPITSDTFGLNDIKGVFVADYLTCKTFKWIYGEEASIVPPKFGKHLFRKHREAPALIWEVPDECSYTDGKPLAIKRQQNLIAGLRKTFPRKQRRAVDCTGLRMLETIDRHLLAYGDFRGAARIWDTLPSLKFIIEYGKNYIALNGLLKEYKNDLIIMRKTASQWEPINTKVSKDVLVINKSDQEKLISNLNPKTRKSQNGKKAFIVHGRDCGALSELKNYLQNTLRMDEPIVLREKPNSGKTIIEKFEKYANETNCAFVLMTPDDKTVGPNKTDKEKRRARQNVIFELGFFYAHFGRKSGRTIVLYKGPIELPTDIDGIVWIDISNGIEQAGEQIRKELDNVNT